MTSLPRPRIGDFDSAAGSANCSPASCKPRTTSHACNLAVDRVYAMTSARPAARPSDEQPAASPVSVIVVATGLYAKLVPALAAGARSHVLGLQQIFALSDSRPHASLGVHWLPWGHISWPYPTLLRYRAITAYADELAAAGVLLYVDVDMRFRRTVDVRRVCGTLAVQHPGYIGAPPNGLPYERRAESRCHITAGLGERYYAGGVQGGRADAYLAACAEMASWVQDDLSHDVIPVWHDESAWNKYCLLNPPTRVLSSAYCSPEYNHDPDAIIVALDKNHDRMRQTPARVRASKYVRQVRARLVRHAYLIAKRVGIRP